MCIDKNIYQCYPIIVDMSVNYKKQVVIISIKTSMQCFIYQVFPKKSKNPCKT